MVTLYCSEARGLHLGPGGKGQTIDFKDGYASFDEAKFPNWKAWVAHPGTPPVRVLEADEGIEGAPETEECPECGKLLADGKKLNQHLMGHRMAAGRAAKKAAKE